MGNTKRILSIVMLLLVGLIMNACGAKKVKLSEGRAVKDGVEVWATWLKDKGKKFDVQFNIHNNSKHDIIVNLGDMSCSRGNTVGMLQHTFFNVGERTIDLRRNQLKTFSLVCSYDDNPKGDYKILISRVYDNPKSDGKERGNVIVSDLVWSARETE